MAKANAPHPLDAMTPPASLSPEEALIYQMAVTAAKDITSYLYVDTTYHATLDVQIVAKTLDHAQRIAGEIGRILQWKREVINVQLLDTKELT